MKWVLVKESDGERGLDGKKKSYEIVLDGRKVTVTWGKFEVAYGQQTQVKEFGSAFLANEWIEAQIHAKRKNGYNLLLVA